MQDVLQFYVYPYLTNNALRTLYKVHRQFQSTASSTLKHTRGVGLRLCCYDHQFESFTHRPTTTATVRDDCRSFREKFHDACVHGKLHVAMEMTSRPNSPCIVQLLYKCTFLETCLAGHLHVIKWFKHILLPGCSVQLRDPADMTFLHLLHARGHGHISEWLFANNFIPAIYLEDAYRNCLQGACTGGHLRGLEWLKKVVGYRFPPPDVEQALSDACFVGDHVHVLEWLDRNKLLPDTATTQRAGLDAFMMACQRRRIQCAKWLLSKYNITKQDFDHDVLINNVQMYCGNVEWLEQLLLLL